MFGHPVTKPLRWEIPLALAGAIVAWFLFVAETDHGCGSLADHVWRFLPLGDVVCDDELRRRRGAIGLVVLVTCLPLVVTAARGFLWGASVLARLERELDEKQTP